MPIFQRLRDHGVLRGKSDIGYGNGYDCLDAYASRDFGGGLVSLARNYYTGLSVRQVRCASMFGCKTEYCNANGYNIQWAGSVSQSQLYLICWTSVYRTVFSDRNLKKKQCYYAPSSPSSYTYDSTNEYSIFAPFRCNAESQTYDYAPIRRYDYRL